MYACIAGTEQGARCRNGAENGQFCSFHQGRKNEGQDVQVAPRPDTVLYKFNLNEKWKEKLMKLGVKEKHPDFQAKEQKHVEHAEQHGREAYRYRSIADSGVPVFGKDGLQSVSLFEVMKELVASYEIVDVHILPKRDGKKYMATLVVSFSHGSEKSISNADAFQELMMFLSSSCWGYCHVWANPPQDDGRVIHTLNSSHREENKKPAVTLRFSNSLWSCS